MLRVQAAQSQRGERHRARSPRLAAAALARRLPAWGCIDARCCSCPPAPIFFQRPQLRPMLQDELRSMSREQWMQQYGGVLQSEEWFEKKSPAWNYDPESW